MRRPRKQRFRRAAAFVAIKWIRRSSDKRLEPGAEIDSAVPAWLLQSWYRKDWIGIVGDPSTEWMLEQYAGRVEAAETKAQAKAEAEGAHEEPSTPDPVVSTPSPGPTEPPEPISKPEKEGETSTPSKAASKPRTRKAPKDKSTKSK